MKTKLIISALLAAGLATAVHAQLSPIAGDLVIGMQGGGQTANDLEIDAGNLANLISITNAAAGNRTELNTNMGATLTSVFGAGWATSGALIGAASTLPDGSVDWVAQAEGVSTGVVNLDGIHKLNGITADTSTFNDTKTLATINSRFGKADLLYGQAGLNVTGSVQPSTAGTPVSVSATSPNSWSIYANNSSNGFAASVDKNTGLALTSSQFEVIDLFQYGTTDTAKGSYAGSIELGGDGSLWFTTAVVAVPEPSTYAAILGAACLSFVAIRRRKQQILA
jgi:hypothetical protein